MQVDQGEVGLVVAVGRGERHEPVGAGGVLVAVPRLLARRPDGCGVVLGGTGHPGQCQVGEAGRQGGVGRGVADARRVRPEGGQQVRPRRVEHGLHVERLAGQGEHDVVFGQHDGELSVGAVAAVAVAGHPELEPVALRPVGVRLARVRDVRARGLGDPLARQQLHAVPLALLQVQLAEGGDRVGGGVQSAEAELAAGRVALPPDLADAERVEQAWSQVLAQRLARDALHDRAGGEGAGLVVGEDGAGLVVGRREQEAPDDVDRVDGERTGEGLGAVPAGHREHVAHEHRAAARVGDLVVEFGEVAEHGVVEPHQALGHGEPDGRRREALAQRVEQVGAVGRVRSPPALGDDLSVAQQHDAVRLDAGRGLEGVDERGDARRVDVLGGGRAARQRRRSHPPTLCPAPEARVGSRGSGGAGRVGDGRLGHRVAEGRLGHGVGHDHGCAGAFGPDEADADHDQQAAAELQRGQGLAEQQPGVERGGRHLEQADERRQAGAEHAARRDARGVRDRGGDDPDHEHRHPPRHDRVEQGHVGRGGRERHEAGQSQQSQQPGADEQARRRQGDRGQVAARPGGEHEVGGAADHRRPRQGEPDGVEGHASARGDDQQEAREGDHGAHEHDGLRDASRGRPGHADEQQRSEVLDQDRGADRDAHHRGEVEDLGAGDADHRHAEHAPPGPPDRTQAAPEGEEGDGGEDDPADQGADRDGGHGTPARLEQRLDERAGEAERGGGQQGDEQAGGGRGGAPRGEGRRRDRGRGRTGAHEDSLCQGRRAQWVLTRRLCGERKTASDKESTCISPLTPKTSSSSTSPWSTPVPARVGPVATSSRPVPS
ncbi:hypothetical protein FRIGORI9N_410010 [Frigoribacterium sp. 9N]|nr:hypothetical protein FRIGORI9N_410010 [Frigoribacterium sp. 9N]